MQLATELRPSAIAAHLRLRGAGVNFGTVQASGPYEDEAKTAAARPYHRGRCDLRMRNHRRRTYWSGRWCRNWPSPIWRTHRHRRWPDDRYGTAPIDGTLAICCTSHVLACATCNTWGNHVPEHASASRQGPRSAVATLSGHRLVAQQYATWPKPTASRRHCVSYPTMT